MSATYPTKLFLAMKSGNLCAMKDCRISLTSDGINSDPAVIGEAAHIYGEKEDAARYDKNMTDEERNHNNNLIYLCTNCHTKIDKQEKDFPAEVLIALKKEHEQWVFEQIDDGMSEITFAELEIASKAIATGKHFENTDFTLITPEEKIKKNDLSCAIQVLIMTGLSRSEEVKNYLSKQAQLDYEFPDRLKNGFVEEYKELKKTLMGDELFMALLKFATRGQTDFKQKAASLAIMTHLFNLCDILSGVSIFPHLVQKDSPTKNYF
jgi:hypothetical protein